MRVIYPREIEAELAFARRAADHFLEHPDHHTFTDGEVQGGKYLAIRWGCQPEKAYAVLVVKLDEYFEPMIYGDMDHDRSREASS